MPSSIAGRGASRYIMRDDRDSSATVMELVSANGRSAYRSAYKGLFRATLGGAGATLGDVFRALAADPGRYPSVRQPSRGVMATRVPLDPEDGQGHWEFLDIADQILVVVTDCDYREARCERVAYEDLVEFHFILKGPVRLDDLESGSVALGETAMLVCSRSPGMEYSVWCPPGPRSLLSLYVRPRFLVEVLGLGETRRSDLAQRILHPPADTIVYYQRPIRLALAELIRQVTGHAITGRRSLLQAEARIYEILSLCADELETATEVARHYDLFTDRDLRIFERAREILMTQFDQPWTISSLARAVGTNTTKLKSGFKLIYGATIFEFSHRHKMAHALHLLAERKLPVGGVARAVGYQHQASFASAFKSHFGLSPKEARKLAPVRPSAP